MKINDVDSRDFHTLAFGLPALIAGIVLASIYVGHVVTSRSSIPTQVSVQAAPPAISVQQPPATVTVAPAQPAVNVTATASPPIIEVKVPQQQPPTVNNVVNTPPAVVTVVSRMLEAEQRQAAPAPKPPDAAKAEAPKPARPLTLDDLYAAAEKYIEGFCKKRGLDPAKEREAWLKRWQDSVTQAALDHTAESEQAYIDRVIVEKRDCLDVERAKPEQVLEGCRLLLRHRDAKLVMLAALQERITPDGIKQTVAALAAALEK